MAPKPAEINAIRSHPALCFEQCLKKASAQSSAKTSMSYLPTTDLCDKYIVHAVDETREQQIGMLQPGLLRDFGQRLDFSGQAVTIKCFENNPLVREVLSEPGRGKVLVVDGGGSMRCALLGDQIAKMAADNGWEGIIINGCVRDTREIGRLPIGVKALAPCPLKSSKRDKGLRDVPVTFGCVTFRPGDWVYADEDGVLVSPEQLTL